MTKKSTEQTADGVPPLPLDAEERAERLGQQARWLMVSYVALTGGAFWFFHESQPQLLMASRRVSERVLTRSVRLFWRELTRSVRLFWRLELLLRTWFWRSLLVPCLLLWRLELLVRA